MKPLINLSEKMYAVFLRFYPLNYRREFGGEMKYVYSQSIKDAYKKEGEQGIVKFWLRTLIDGVNSLFNQHLEDNKEGGGIMKLTSDEVIKNNRIFVRIAGVTLFVLSIPLIAMQFTREVDWKLGDFLIIGILIFGTGFVFVQVARLIPEKYRVIVGVAFLVALLLTWVHLAVGVVDTWPLSGS